MVTPHLLLQIGFNKVWIRSKTIRPNEQPKPRWAKHIGLVNCIPNMSPDFIWVGPGWRMRAAYLRHTIRPSSVSFVWKEKSRCQNVAWKTAPCHQCYSCHSRDSRLKFWPMKPTVSNHSHLFQNGGLTFVQMFTFPCINTPLSYHSNYYLPFHQKHSQEHPVSQFQFLWQSRLNGEREHSPFQTSLPRFSRTAKQ